MSETGSQYKPLEQVEWDFSDVPERDLDACFLWECGRELPDLGERISQWQKLSDSPFYVGDIAGPRRRAGLKHPLMFVGLTHLLDCPWAFLPDDIHEYCHEGLPRPFYETEGTPSKLELSLPNTPGTGIQLAHLNLDWESPDAELIQEFSLWLRRTRKQPPRENRGSNRRDHLKMLGAMRLLHHYSLYGAIDVTSRALGAPLYGKRPSWERARKGAVTALAEALLFDPKTLSDPDILKSYPKLKSRFRNAAKSA